MSYPINLPVYTKDHGNARVLSDPASSLWTRHVLIVCIPCGTTEMRPRSEVLEDRRRPGRQG